MPSVNDIGDNTSNNMIQTIQTASPTSNSHLLSTPLAQHSAETIHSFVIRNGKKPQGGRAIDGAVRCLETEVGRPANEKKRINIGDLLGWSSPETPSAARSPGSRSWENWISQDPPFSRMRRNRSQRRIMHGNSHLLTLRIIPRNRVNNHYMMSLALPHRHTPAPWRAGPLPHRTQRTPPALGPGPVQKKFSSA